MITLPLPPPPTNRLVQDVIQDQVTARPHAPATYACDGQFTYHELDRLSSRLAVLQYAQESPTSR